MDGSFTEGGPPSTELVLHAGTPSVNGLEQYIMQMEEKELDKEWSGSPAIFAKN
jgi:hypothetical protein